MHCHEKGMGEQEKDRGRCNLEQLAYYMHSVNGIQTEKQYRLALIDFLQGVLKLDPIVRWSPQQAKNHPFITGERFTGPYQPDKFRRAHVAHPTANSPPMPSNLIMPTIAAQPSTTSLEGPILPITQPVMSNARIQETFAPTQKLRPRSKTFSDSSSSSSPSSSKQRSNPVETMRKTSRHRQYRRQQMLIEIINGQPIMELIHCDTDSDRRIVSRIQVLAWGKEGLKRRSRTGPRNLLL